MDDTLVRLASLLALAFIRSAEGFFSTHFCHERLERVINSNGNHAKPSPPLPASGQVDLSCPGTSLAQGLRQGPSTTGAAGACRRRQLPKGMPKFAGGGKVHCHRGCPVIGRCFHNLLSLCSQYVLPKTEVQDEKTQLLLWLCKTRLVSSEKNPTQQTTNPLAKLTNFSKTAFFSPGK